MVNRNVASEPIWNQNQGQWVEERKEPEEVLPPSPALLPSLPPYHKPSASWCRDSFWDSFIMEIISPCYRMLSDIPRDG